MNDCVVVGRVMEVPEVKTVGKGLPLTSLLIESDRNFRDENGNVQTDVFNVSVWRGAAEQASAILKKGDMVAIRGRLTGRMVEKEDKTYYFTEVVGESIEYLRSLNRYS